ncbi:hypothetical protein QU487_24120 [Crenobacter sp. SG2305]|uniref:hypothetical protein n=1 Tax=Crenobacter oryzisoli TaxID=3056844 RepID=UPI0025AA50D5|nr:hypothetical protein [Crenobacter sp. SG2305]MDN0085770.1 hypothetical protein [Crenobacter sp. SG2305]
MRHLQAQRVIGRRVTAQLVGDDHARTPMAFEPLAHPPFGRCLATPALHRHIEHGAVLIHRAPPPVLLAVDRHHDFIKMPLITPAQGGRADVPGGTARSLIPSSILHRLSGKREYRHTAELITAGGNR